MKVTLLINCLLVLIIGSSNAASNCNCWQNRDSTWGIAQFTNGIPPDYRNDDGSTALITLPFNFCFYGDTVTEVYINNNGNISFNTAFSTYTATGFPDPQFSMVAPFWGDVDTRDTASGLVYYKMYSNYLVVQWDSVGYFDQHVDLRNTFQLIISNGSASVLPENKNVGFCYKKMEWTTGDASQGINGFGGVPATVGTNYGDGINYLQIGRYIDSTFNYDGPYANDDGVQSLSFQSFAFDICVTNFNVPPILSGQYLCDTIDICVGDTFIYNANFIAPEQSQNTAITYNAHGNATVSMTTVPGNNASMSLTYIPSVPGTHTIDIIGTDDAFPPGITTLPLIFNVQNCTTGILQASKLSNVLSPNPFTNSVKYSFDESTDVIVTNPEGKVIYSGKGLINGSIDTSVWKNGMYYVAMNTSKGRTVSKLIKN
jgi:hypothetical protein